MTPPDRMPLDDLLAQAGWAKALARQLVRDEHSADDLVQRAWVAALEHPPALAGSGAPATLRRWMASVMRNFVRQDLRERDRRVQREHFAARPESSPDAVEDGIEGQRKLLEALRALPEAYRAALYARYFEGLMPREIARREGSSLKTVKSKLARGLELLRQRLDRDHNGDRGAWLVWILPMTAKSGLPTALLGALIVNSKVKLAALLAVAVCLLAAGVQLVRREANLPDPAPVHAAAQAALPTPTEPSLQPGEARERESVSRPESVAAVVAPHPVLDSQVPTLVRGRVLDLDNRPVGGVRLVCESDERSHGRKLEVQAGEPSTSDELGYFEMSVSERSNVLVDDPRWVTVYKAYIAGPTTREATIFVAPRRVLSGVVVDAEQRTVEGAEVELRLADSVKRKLERRLDGAYRQNFMTVTDANGRFKLERAPACEAELFASAPGWKPGTIAAPSLDASDLRIVLAAREKRPAIVQGIVVDGDRQPVAGANVGVGGLTRTTAADGRFTFDLDAQGHGDIFAKGVDDVWRAKYPRDRLRAVKLGHLPCEVVLPSAEELREDPLPREFTLVLEGSTLTIRGHVVDAEGNQVAGARISVLDEAPFGPIYSRVGEAAVAREVSIEGLLRGGADFRDSPASNDGAFVITGLTHRSYDLAALDPSTMRHAILRGVAAGTSDARLLLPGKASLVHVAGRLVSKSSSSLEGINVTMGRVSETNPDDQDFVSSKETDARGQFDLGMIDPERLRIQVVGEEIFLIMAWQPPQGAKLDDLEIPVSLRCPIKLELGPGAPAADAFSFVDAAGTATQIIQFEGPMLMMPERCSIQSGASEVVATEDTSTSLVLYQAGKEIARVPIRLKPGELTILRP